MRLECQSAGGRPAPRVEWLNVSRRAGQSSSWNDDDERASGNQQAAAAAAVQLMRLHWPQKKSTSYETNLQQQQVPITSSALSISLSRYDLHSQFACLVLPTYLPELGLSASQQRSAQPPQQLTVEQLIKSPAYLSSLLNQRIEGAPTADNRPGADAGAPMLKWIKLDVQG